MISPSNPILCLDINPSQNKVVLGTSQSSIFLFDLIKLQNESNSVYRQHNKGFDLHFSLI